MLDRVKYIFEMGKIKDELGYLSNCSVALVGNAQSIFDKQHGVEIDQHDVVVRMNAGWPIDPRCQGQRTDLLCLSMGLTAAEILEKYGSPKLIWMTPKRRIMHNSVKNRGLYIYPRKCWDLLREELEGNRPSTGAMAIDLFCRQLGVQRISLYGFDFKKTKTFYLENDHVGPHRFDLEEILIRKILSGKGQIH